MPLKPLPRCAAIHNAGPWKGKRCTERRNLVKCSNSLVNGCENYYCLVFHWPEHWHTHDEEVTTSDKEGALSDMVTDPEH